MLFIPYEERMRRMYQKKCIGISIAICVAVFVISFFVTGFVIKSMKDQTAVNEICHIHGYVDLNRDIDKLAEAVKKDFPEYKMEIEIDNLEERTVLTIYKNTDYQVRVNYDKNMNYFSSRIIDDFEVNRIDMQILISIVVAILTMITCLLISADYIHKKMQLIVS